MYQDISAYYHARAKEYDRVYQIPEEQEDLKTAASLFQQLFRNKSVLEIACGTGYWTEQISSTAHSILATDINQAVINIARTRKFNGHVEFQVSDMNALSADQPFEGLFGGFIWSHILLQELDGFLSRVHDLLMEGADIVFIDSKPVGRSHDPKRISRIDSFGNTFQTRTLEDGSVFEVLKNFPDKEFLQEKLSAVATDIRLEETTHYWIVFGKRV